MKSGSYRLPEPLYNHSFLRSSMRLIFCWVVVLGANEPFATVSDYFDTYKPTYHLDMIADVSSS